MKEADRISERLRAALASNHELAAALREMIVCAEDEPLNIASTLARARQALEKAVLS